MGLFPTIDDASGNGHTGTCVNMEAADVNSDTPGGVSVRSLLFDGVDESVDVGTVPSALNFERTNPFSISAWIKTSSATGQAICGNQGPTTLFRGYLLNFGSTGRVEFFLLNDWGGGAGNGIYVNTVTTGFNNGAWRHVVVTYSGSSTAAGVTFYVDGSSQSKTTSLDTLSLTTQNSENFRIGRRNDPSSQLHWNGRLDDIAVYDKELTSGEVTTIYNSGAPTNLNISGPTGNLVAWWQMGDQVGSIPGDEVLGGAGIAVPESQVTLDLRAAGSITEFGTGGGPSITTYFKMRALEDPTNNYLVWVVTGTPDTAGTFAPGTIFAGTAIVLQTWQV